MMGFLLLGYTKNPYFEMTCPRSFPYETTKNALLLAQIYIVLSASFMTSVEDDIISSLNRFLHHRDIPKNFDRSDL
jgi:hypothetical protein